MTSLQEIYNSVIDGRFQTYDQLADIVQRISQLIPELDINSSGGIDNYTQKELENIVKQFIVRVQNQQINFVQDDNKQRNKIQNKDYDINKWVQKIHPYYEANKNNLKDLPQILNINDNHPDTYTKIYRCLNTLDLLTDVIFNSRKKQFELICLPNKSGTQGAKLTLNLFKRVIKQKIQTDQKQGLLQLQSLNKLHMNVKETYEYKYFCKLMQILTTQKKFNKFNKYMNKPISEKVKPTLKQVGDKIFNKFKSFKNKDGENQNYTDQGKQQTQRQIQECNLYYSKPMKDVTFKQKQKYDIKVLDDIKKVQNLYGQKQKVINSKQLLTGLPYIPTESMDYLDSVKPVKYAINFDNLQRDGRAIVAYGLNRK